MQRKLVTIRVIQAIHPIPDADNIEIAVVDGWEVIVKKGIFKVGDWGLYFEIDSFLPIEERYEFLRKSSYRKLVDGSEGFRIKTIKLRGQISQGLLLPLSDFPYLEYNLESDYTQALHVSKWEPTLPVHLAGAAKGMFPSFIEKTDENRIQNLTQYFKLYPHIKFEVSEKVDGSSLTCYYNNGDIGVCSRNIDLKEDDNNSFWNTAHRLNLRDILLDLKKNIAIQGELVGPGIQKNTLKLKKLDLLVFNIWDIDNQRYLLPSERKKLISQIGLNNVPIIEDSFDIFTQCTNVKDILTYAEQKSIINPDMISEGIVCKSCEYINERMLSFKVLNNTYLLKNED